MKVSMSPRATLPWSRPGRARVTSPVLYGSGPRAPQLRGERGMLAPREVSRPTRRRPRSGREWGRLTKPPDSPVATPFQNSGSTNRSDRPWDRPTRARPYRCCRRPGSSPSCTVVPLSGPRSRKSFSAPPRRRLAPGRRRSVVVGASPSMKSPPPPPWIVSMHVVGGRVEAQESGSAPLSGWQMRSIPPSP